MRLQPGAEPFAFDGGPVGALLLHGFTGCPQSMRPWGEAVAAAGLTVVGPRLPGHGTRWQDLQLTTWHDWYGEAEHAFTDLRRRCEQVFVMGLSVGGCLALRLAEERPGEVAGLVVVNPSLLTRKKLARIAPLLAYVLPSYAGVVSDIKKPGVRELGYDRIPVKAFVSLTALWATTRAGLGKVTAPLLVFRSAVDHVVEPESSAAVLAEVGSAEREERVLRDSYHVATLDNDAQSIFDGSLAFVRAHTAERSAT
jgi:carboxylesterase